MARKKEAVKMPGSPKAPWENYDPLSLEVYGEPFEVKPFVTHEEDDRGKEMGSAVEEGPEVDLPGAVEAPPDVEAPEQELIPNWNEGEVEEVAGTAAVEEIPEARPVVKEGGPRVVRKMAAPEPAEADGPEPPSEEKVMVPTKITRRRVIRRRKVKK